MDRSLRFGSWSCDSIALLGLAFATASPHGLTSPHNANSQAHSSKGTLSQVPKYSLQRIVGTWFQVLFHSPPGVLFTFPSRYLSAIGHQGVFRLNGWSRQIHTEFQGFRVTWGDASEPSSYVYGGITLYAGTFQSSSTSTMVSYSVLGSAEPAKRPHNPTQQRLPAITLHGLASSDFARHYSRNHCCFLFLWVLRCFTSPRSLQLPYVFRQR